MWWLPTEQDPPEETPVTPDQLKHFQQKLQTLRADLLRELEASAAIGQPEDTHEGDQSDQASAETDRDLVGLNRERIRMLLGQADAALARIENGTYGICEDTGRPIGLKRLEAQPTATLSVEALETRERAER
jgi:DnaK suppressor protein